MPASMDGNGRKTPDNAQEKALWDAFQKFDSNGDGKIQAEEFYRLMTSLGSFSQREIARLFAEADTDGSGGVDWREFLKWICSGNATKDMSSSGAKSFTRLIRSEAFDEASFAEEAAVSHAVTTYLRSASLDSEGRNAKSATNKTAQAQGHLTSSGPPGDLDVGSNYKGFRITDPMTFENAEGLMKHYLLHGTSKPLHWKYVKYLTHEFTDAYRQRHPKPVVHTSTPPNGRLIIVGDTHGQLADVLHILYQLGPPTAQNRYLFNGDIADRGPQAVEIFIIVFAFFLADPESIIVHRGNHENEDMNALDLDSGGGFSDEVMQKYGAAVYKLFVDAFKVLSLCSVVQKEIFVVHGGLTRVKTLSLDYINSLEHTECTAPHPMATNVKDQIFSDLLWSDPTTVNGKFKSDRGIGIKFGPDMTMKFCMHNRLRFIVRSHQVPDDGRGYAKQHDGRCVTVFSASNYCGNGGNYGAVLVLAAANFPKYEIYEHYAVSLEELALSVEQESAKAKSDEPAGSKPDQEACSASRWTKELQRMIVALIERKPQMWSHVVSMSVGSQLSMDDFEELANQFVEGPRPWAEAAKTWGLVTPNNTVEVGRFLGRWAVIMDSERYASFLMRAVTQVYEAILKLDMDLEQSLRLFDADGDGLVELKEVRSVLNKFDLGLTQGQLDRLTGQIFNSAAEQSKTGKSIGKINVQEFLGHFTMIYKQSSVNGPKLETWMMDALEQIGRLIVKTPADTLLSELEQATLKIQKVVRGTAVRREMRQAKDAGGDGLGHKKARGKGFSAKKASPHASGGGEEAEGMSKMAKLFRALDFENEGVMQNDNFVRSLERLPGINEIMVHGKPLSHERLVNMVEAIDFSRSGTINYMEFLQAFQTSEVGSRDVGESLLEDITTVLFRHRLAIRKGCAYFDEEGAGRITSEEFRRVMHAVNNTLARPERTLTTAQINLLAEALADNEKSNDEAARAVDYEAFLRSFIIIDKENHRGVVKRF